MRDSNRIYPFVNEIATLWQQYFPNWRFSQLMNVFENWVITNKGYNDLFYIEDDRFIELFKEFAEAVDVKH